MSVCAFCTLHAPCLQALTDLLSNPPFFPPARSVDSTNEKQRPPGSGVGLHLHWGGLTAPHRHPPAGAPAAHPSPDG